jgi:hypothetical protein
VAFAGSESTGEIDETDDDEDYRPGVAEVKESAAHLRQEKKHADGDNDDGAHEAARGATLTGATNTITHV